jgi:hypothetical protein
MAHESMGIIQDILISAKNAAKTCVAPQFSAISFAGIMMTIAKEPHTRTAKIRNEHMKMARGNYFCGLSTS